MKSSQSTGTLFLILGVVTGFCLAQYLTAFWAPVGQFLTACGVPVPWLLGAVVLVAGIVGCSWLQGAAVRALPAGVELQPTRADRFPALDIAALYQYSRALEAAGFVRAVEYRVRTGDGRVSAGFARLFVHPEHLCYAEVNQLFPVGANPGPMRCVFQSLFEDGWSWSTSDRKPELIQFLLRRPRTLWSCRPGTGVEELLDMHLESRSRLAEGLGLALAVEPSVELYFEQARQAAEARREVVGRKHVLALLAEAVLFSLKPRFDWLGAYRRVARRQKTQRLVEA